MAQTNPKQLAIYPGPLKPSPLPYPSSPLTPRSPTTQGLSPPPSPPKPWVWQCHMCNRIIWLSATRRCIFDGHRFCKGTTKVKSRRGKANPRKKDQNKACINRFDYQGWVDWGEWRRSVTAANEDGSSWSSRSGGSDSKAASPAALPAGTLRDCWNHCDFPSECELGPGSASRNGNGSPAMDSIETSEPPHGHLHRKPVPIAPWPPLPPAPLGGVHQDACSESAEACSENAEPSEEGANGSDSRGTLTASTTRLNSAPPQPPPAGQSGGEGSSRVPEPAQDENALSASSSSSPSSPLIKPLRPADHSAQEDVPERFADDWTLFPALESDLWEDEDEADASAPSTAAAFDGQEEDA